MTALPTFSMPACSRHFFKGHKWWCRACDRETESQFRDVCEAAGFEPPADHTPTPLQIAQCVSDCFEPSDVSAIQRVIAEFGFLVADALIKRGFVAVSDAPGSPEGAE